MEVDGCSGGVELEDPAMTVAEDDDDDGDYGDDEEDEDEGSGTEEIEFKASTWNKDATPTKSLLKSPDKNYLGVSMK